MSLHQPQPPPPQTQLQLQLNLLCWDSADAKKEKMSSALKGKTEVRATARRNKAVVASLPVAVAALLIYPDRHGVFLLDGAGGIVVGGENSRVERLIVRP